MIFDLWPHSKVISLTLQRKFTCIMFCPSSPLIWHATCPCLKNINVWLPGHPQHPKSHPWDMPHRRQNKNPVWYVLYLLFVRTHTKLGIKIFEIDFVIEIKWNLFFWPLPMAQGGGGNFFAVARPMHVSNSHTKFGWIWSNGLGGDSITDRPSDRI